MDATERLSPDQLQRAADLLKAGHLVAFPTETVYGLGAPIFSPEAIQSIFKVKGRPADNPLIAHVSSVEQVSRIALEIPEAFYRLAEVFFPGPLTVVLKRRPDVPSIVSAGLETIAVRMPSHPIALKLISLVDEPLVAPSANLSGMPSSTQAEHVLDDFDGKIAAVVDGGKTEIGIESTVINLLGETPILLRPGSISKEALEKVLGYPIFLPLVVFRSVPCCSNKARGLGIALQIVPSIWPAEELLLQGSFQGIAAHRQLHSTAHRHPSKKHQTCCKRAPKCPHTSILPSPSSYCQRQSSQLPPPVCCGNRDRFS